MRLPININDMLTARVIEWEQLEFKAGWDHVKVMKTMCAFSYDFNNLGSRHILINVPDFNNEIETLKTQQKHSCIFLTPKNENSLHQFHPAD
ncbi:MAG: hypothetical protein OMM_13195 [Candidatus Magnetoglobus multicellularis str. Araruama]|uniref:Uncharacterized protein n=1 Tax=Candidatus Magnetoglobus multicellularis str. Araruama TaxID=890399 RepID=A0A1V1NU78_9BACT|nr:MAG: hypothetical protein OMM_13195 [Candidatus Magnetoglobus multicellularis str. Araruama]